ncbi:MAG: calcium/sodium antiporter [Bacteroidales bacterium]|nr:calcium/sodium antiporter [Bacteroidales bacterium]
MLNLLFIIIGFALLVYGADYLVDGGASLAKKFNVPNMVIGLTIVAFGTSSPELAVNVTAAIGKNSDITLGNVLGSNIFNILLILGVATLFNHLRVKTNTTWVEVPLALLSAFLVFVLAGDAFIDNRAPSVIGRIDGIVLLMFFVVFLAYNLHLIKSGTTDETFETKNLSAYKSLIFIVLGLAMLIGGGKLIVYSASEMARALGISERIIALTIVSIGTSLPELATSIIAVRKNNVDIAIGNVVGSNIFNIFFILGVSAVINPVTIGTGSMVDLLVNIFSGLLLFLFIFTGKGRKIETGEGIVFILLYLSYIVYLIIG